MEVIIQYTFRCKCIVLIFGLVGPAVSEVSPEHAPADKTTATKSNYTYVCHKPWVLSFVHVYMYMFPEHWLFE